MIAIARKRRRARQSAGLYDEIVVDLFAGGGGASVGIEEALGRSVDVAVNHDRAAVAMHQANHPHTHHLRSDVFEVSPEEATGGRPVGLLWASPDCTYHSKARGAAPIRSSKSRRRSLAWVVIKWAARVKPRLIMLENVEEFADWCPLVPQRHANGQPVKDADGATMMRPCERRRGQTFRRWVRELRRLGYAVEWRELRACDYGSPTTRKRLFVIARCDGQPIVWPERTHGEASHLWISAARMGDPVEGPTDRACHHHFPDRGSHRRQSKSKGAASEWTHSRSDSAPDRADHDVRRVRPYRTAAECIDWSLPCPSIFLTPAEAKAIGCRRPLKPATLARIARGVKKYVIDAAEPFIVGVGGPAYSAKPVSVHTPLRTVLAADRRAVVAPVLTPRYTERKGQSPRCRRVDQPAPTIVPRGNGAQLVAAHLSAAHQGGAVASAAAPMRTVTASRKDQHHVVAAYLAQHNGGMVGHHATDPLSTLSSKGAQQQVVAASLMINTTGHSGGAADRPAPTVTTGGHHAVCLTHLRGTNAAGGPVDAPLPTITAAGTHAGLVYAFLASYYGTGIGQEVTDPLRTVPTHERFACVAVHGVPHAIVDIGMRMLTPRELYRCQGFGDDYVIDCEVDGRKLTKTEQVRLVGNSVCPQVAAALVRANVPAEVRS